MQLLTKLRAPRCSDAMFSTSLPACSSPPPPSDAHAGLTAVSASASAIAALLVGMVGHPFRHRLGCIDFRVPGHENEERKVDSRKDTCKLRVERRDVLQAEVAERDEAQREGEQERFEDPASITYRLDRRAIEPGKKEERHDRGAHQHDTEELVRYRSQDCVVRCEVPDRRDVLG